MALPAPQERRVKINIFKVSKDIRVVGYNYGLPMMFVDCGMGMRLAPEDVIKKLVQIGLGKGDWVVIRKGLGEKGIVSLIDGLKHLGCKVEVEATGSNPTPSWLLRVDSFLVWWDGSREFTFSALRKSQDLVVAPEERLDEMLEEIGGNDLIDKGVLRGTGALEKLIKWKVRVY